MDWFAHTMSYNRSSTDSGDDTDAEEVAAAAAEVMEEDEDKI